MLPDHQMRDKSEFHKINIKPFEGNLKHFKAFKEMYFRKVNSQWPESHQFMFLQSHLLGEAYNAVASLSTNRHTHALAWEILDRRFDNRRGLLELAIKDLSPENCSIDHNNPTSGKKFRDTYQNIRANIELIAATTDEVLVEIILTRMNPVTRARFEDFVGTSSDTPSFKLLDTFMVKELRI